MRWNRNFFGRGRHVFRLRGSGFQNGFTYAINARQLQAFGLFQICRYRKGKNRVNAEKQSRRAQETLSKMRCPFKCVFSCSHCFFCAATKISPAPFSFAQSMTATSALTETFSSARKITDPFGASLPLNTDGSAARVYLLPST